MAQRPIWRGHLRLALVSCPVALYSAKHDRGSLHFNLINPDTGNRIRMITQDAETGQPLERKNLVKGYEFKKNTYVLLSDEDFQSVKVPSSSVMNIEKFVEAGTIDPLYYDTSYYLARMAKPAGMSTPFFVRLSKGPAGLHCHGLSSPNGSERSRCALWRGASWPIPCTSNGTSTTQRQFSRAPPPSRPIRR